MNVFNWTFAFTGCYDPVILIITRFVANTARWNFFWSWNNRFYINLAEGLVRCGHFFNYIYTHNILFQSNINFYHFKTSSYFFLIFSFFFMNFSFFLGLGNFFILSSPCLSQRIIWAGFLLIHSRIYSVLILSASRAFSIFSLVFYFYITISFTSSNCFDSFLLNSPFDFSTPSNDLESGWILFVRQTSWIPLNIWKIQSSIFKSISPRIIRISTSMTRS